MAASAPRATPTYNLPPSQNTAPVLEFRCLYTHDLFKKQKKWHDGSLKFHTFNRRVMVYDDIKNYIGDLHYRQDEEFGEGVEIQLDRGVKVEIGEPLGQTQTDLTPLLEKVRHGRDIPARAESNASARVVQRVTATNAQHRPKSLAELLGPSQGRRGRTRLPLQSPFERRQALAHDAQHDQPPTKRQKLATGKENVQVVSHTKNEEYQVERQASSPDRLSPPARSRGVRSVLPKSTPIAAKDVFEISSDEEARDSTRRKLPESRKSKQAQNVQTIHTPDPEPLASTRTAAAAISVGPTSQQSCMPKDSNKSLETHNNGALDHIRKKQPTKLWRSQATLDGRSGDSVTSSTVSLKIAVLPPRRKLMHEALLPSSVATHSPKASSASLHKRNSNEAVISSTGPTNRFGGAIQDTQTAFTLDDLGEDLSELPEDVVVEPQRAIEQCLDETDHNPLFFSQISFPASPPPSQEADDAIEFVSTQTFAETEDATTTHAATQHVSEEAIINIESSQAFDALVEQQSTMPSPGPQADQSLEPNVGQSLDAAGLAKSPAPLLRSPSNTRLLRRNLSENDSPSLARSPQQPLLASPIRNRANLRVENTSDHDARQNISERSLQRSRSDTAAMLPAPISAPITVESIGDVSISEMPKAAAAAAGDQEEQGPWSKLEAFLLFAQWPAAKAKDKPSYSIPDRRHSCGQSIDNYRGDEFDEHDMFTDDVQLSLSTARIGTAAYLGSAAKKPKFPGITSARAIHDDGR